MELSPLTLRRGSQLSLGLDTSEPMSPLHVTHQGGRGEPFHDWYPYLEGFSSEFVRKLLTEHMPGSRRIVEPFAGTGTTAVVLSQLGVECGYCEVNPAMRMVIEAKMTLGNSSNERRLHLAKRLRTISRMLPTLVGEASRDEVLVADYRVNFEDSVFFEPDALEALLAMRSVNDELKTEDSLLGDMFTIAVMAKIVICSRLKRAGDVRYKTEKELSRGIPSITTEVSRQLLLIATDCVDAPHLFATAHLLRPNARELIGVPSFEADGVITSPPYLNGTNYFRNTKLELWFGRFLSGKSTLRSYRDEAITSGINDVGIAQGRVIVHPSVERTVHELKTNAYDQRIPRMVAGYFEDMRKVLEGLRDGCKPGAAICIDIGDSRYGGIHVPTHDILAEIGLDVGLEHEQTIHLRDRISKDRSLLSQSLIVLRKPLMSRKPVSADEAVARDEPVALDRWEKFKATMPHQAEPFSKRNWGSPLHSVCSYQAKMKPSLAHHLVAAFSDEGDLVVDPFSGSGSIPYEACLMGRRGLGLDISMLGTAVSNAKLMAAEPNKVEEVIQQLATWLKKRKPAMKTRAEADEVRFNGPLNEYFHVDTYNEVLAARDFFAANYSDSAEWHLVMACMLHILHGNRPYALSRNSHPITPYAPTGEYEYKSVVEKLRAKVEKSLAAQLPDGLPKGRCFQADICEPWPEEMRGIDAIITSPPFFDSTRFYMTNWMRYWFCGWSRSDFDTKTNLFVESLQKKSLDVYRGIFDQFAQRLRTGGVAVLHLGISHKCDMASELAKRATEVFEVADIATESVGHCESHGIRDKGTTTGHQYLVLRKP